MRARSMQPQTGTDAVLPLADEHLVLTAVSKRFAGFLALDDINLTVPRGSFTCFLGPSGCGKTTLLRAIAGLDLHSSGRIFMDGKDVSGLPPEARDFGIVFQSYALFPNLTVAENIGYGLVNRRMSRGAIAAKVSSLLDLVGLAPQAQKYPGQISGGQQQRVALARALALEPGLLLLDEPLSALDARVRQHLRTELKDLQRRLGVTTIMVTHDQEEALTLADRIVVMNRGRIEQVGTPEAIYRTPATAFVADFVGRMNSLDGIWRTGGVEVAGRPFILPTRAGEVSAFAEGAPVKLCIRPEEVVLQPSLWWSPNSLKGRIAHIEFQGNCQLVTAETEGSGMRLAVHVALGGRHVTPLQEGQAISLSLPPEALHVFAA